MGNCAQRGQGGRICEETEEQFISVMKVDGKILEYKAPLSVKDLLMDYECHVVVDPDQVVRHPFPPEYELLPGHMYCLLPLEESSCVQKKEEETKEMDPSKSGVVRVKVVIKKQQLAELLVSNKGMSLEDLVRQIQSKSHPTTSNFCDSSSPKLNCSGWRPSLDSIPELCDVMG